MTIKKDPSLQDQDDFDTDFSSELDQGNSQLDDVDFNIEEMDSDEERKPVTKAEIVTDSLRVAGKKASAGAVTGITAALDHAIPEVKDVRDSIVDIASQAEMLRSDTANKIRPLLNQSRNVSKQLLRQAEGFLPKSIYTKVMEKLTVSDDGYRSPSKEESRRNATQEALNEVFKMQSAAAEESRKEAFVQHAVDQQINQTRHTEIAGLINDIRNQQIFSTEFTRSTYTAYLKKDLELKYRMLYLSEDQLEVARVTSRLLEKKLDDIRHNTALPDYAKIQLLELGKRKIIEQTVQGIGGKLANYGSQVLKNIKTQFIEPALGNWGTINDSLGAMADMMEMDDEFDIRRAAAGSIGGFVGKTAGKMLSKKFLDKLDPQAKKTMANYLRMGSSGIALLMDDLKNGKVEIPGLEFNSPIFSILEKILPNLDRGTGTVVNKAFSDPTGHAEITNKFVATVEEIIPGYLSLQTQYLERLATSLAGDVKAERQAFDFETGKFTRVSVLQDKIGEKIRGDKRDRAAIMNANTTLFRQDLGRFKDTKTAETFENVERDISLLMMNAARLKMMPSSILSFAILKDIADQSNQGVPFDDIYMPEDTRKCFHGIKNPVATVQTLVSFFTDIDGSVRSDTISTFYARIVELIRGVVDNHRKEFFKQAGLYGREVMGDLTTTATNGDIQYSKAKYDTAYDDLTEEDYSKIDTSLYDEHGFRIKEKTAYDITKDLVGNSAQYAKDKLSKAGAFADRVISRAAAKMGKEQEWEDFKEVAAKRIEAVAKWWDEKKATLKSVSTKIKDTICNKIYQWLTTLGKKHKAFATLRDLIFTKEHKIRKSIEATKLASLLVKVPKLYSLSHHIYTHSRNEPLYKMLWAFLPKPIQLLAQLSEKEVQEVIKAEEPERLLITYVDPKNFSDGSYIKPAPTDMSGEFTTKAAGDIPTNYYDDAVTDSVNADLTDTEAELVKEVYRSGPEEKSTSVKNDQDRAKDIVAAAGDLRATMGDTVNGEPWGAYNKPTVFANGNAVMGEAGPEVIVPMNQSNEAKAAYSQAKAYFESHQDIAANIPGYTAHRTQGKFSFAKGGKVNSETGEPEGFNGDDPNDEIKRKAEQAAADSLAGKVGQSVKDMVDKLKDFFGKKSLEETIEKTYTRVFEKFKKARSGKTATGESTQTSPPDEKEKKTEQTQSEEQRFKEYGKRGFAGKTKSAFTTGAEFLTEASGRPMRKLLEVNEAQLDIQKRILLQLMTGVVLSPGTKKTKVDKELLKAYKGQFRSGADKAWSAIKWTGARIKNVTWDAPRWVGSNVGHQIKDAARDTFVNAGETVYRKPAKGEPIDYEHPLISRDQWKRGIYADPDRTQLIKSTADITGPVWDVDGRQLISEVDYRAGLVDAKGRRIRGPGAWLGRRMHHLGAGAWNIGEKGVGILDKFGISTKIWESAKHLASTPGAFLSGLTKKFCDVGIKTDQGVQIKVYANDFENGLVQFRNGKKPKTSFNIDEPLYWTDDPVNRANNRVGAVAISNEDIRNGLVDSKGKPVSRLSRLVGAGLRIGGEFMANTVGTVFGKGGDILTFAFNTVKKVAKALWKSKNPFIDVFVADEKGNIDPKKPALLGTGIRDGKYVFLDGETVKSAYNIKGAVRDAETGNILITEEQVTNGVFDVKGRKLTRFAGRSIIGKAASMITNSTWHVAKFGAKLGVKLLKGAGKALGGLKKLGKWITTGAFDNISDIAAYMNNVWQESLSTIMKSDTVRRTDLEQLVTTRLDTIISIMKGGNPDIPSSGSDTGSPTPGAGGPADGSEDKDGNKNKGGPSAAKVKTGKNWFERKAEDLQHRIDAMDREMDEKEKERKDFGEVLHKALADFFPKRKKTAGDTDGDGTREGSYEDQQAEKKAEREAAAKMGWMSKLKGLFGRGGAAAAGAGAAGAAGGGDTTVNIGGGGSIFDMFGGGGNNTPNGPDAGKKPGFFSRMASRAGNLINKIPGGRFVTGAASKVGNVISKVGSVASRIPGVSTVGRIAGTALRLTGGIGGNLLRMGGSALLGGLGGLGGLASGAVGLLGSAAGAIGSVAAAAAPLAAAAAPVLLAGAAAAAVGYGAYKLGSWLFGDDSDVVKKWGDARYKAYGLDYAQHKDALEEFEEDTMSVLMEGDSVDEDDFEDVAEDLGLITDDDDDATRTKKLKYFNEWYRHRFILVLAAYIRTVKLYIEDTNTDDPDDIDPDDIPEEKQGEALKRFEKEYTPYLSEDAKKLVPTLEGYKGLVGKKDEEKKKKEEAEAKAKAKENDGAPGDTNDWNANPAENAKKVLEEHKEEIEAKKEKIKTLVEKSKEMLKLALNPGGVLAGKLIDAVGLGDAFSSLKSSVSEVLSSAIPKVADVAKYAPIIGAPIAAASWLAGKLGFGGGPEAPELDLKNLSAANISDGGIGDLGSYVQEFESGRNGPSAIGWDSTGGTSYGTYQIASKTGTMTKFLEFAKTHGGEFGRKLAEEMSKGPIDTGSRKGYGPDIWKQFAEVDGGKALHKLEQGFIKATHYDPAYNEITDPEARALIDNDRGLKEALWSTSIQHGAGKAMKGGAAGIFTKTFKSGMSAEEWLTAIYAKRGTQFGSSTPRVRQSVLNRYKRELPIVLGLSKTSIPAELTESATSGAEDTQNSVGASSDVTAGSTSLTSGGDGHAATASTTPSSNTSSAGSSAPSSSINSSTGSGNTLSTSEIQQAVASTGKTYNSNSNFTSTPNSSSDTITSIANSTLPSSTTTPGSSISSTPASSGVSTITTSNPINTSSSDNSSNSAQLQEQKLTNRILETLGTKLDQLVETAKKAAISPSNVESTSRSRSNATTANVGTIDSNLNITNLTTAFSNALNQAFAPGTPIYSLFSNLTTLNAQTPTSTSGSGVMRTSAQKVQAGIDVSKSRAYNSMRA